MDTLHEPVKVHPELLLNIQALKEDVHEVGLTSPHATPDIQALLWQGMPTKVPAHPRPQPPIAGRAGAQAMKQLIEPGYHCRLRSILEKQARLQVALIARHGREWMHHDLAGGVNQREAYHGGAHRLCCAAAVSKRNLYIGQKNTPLRHCSPWPSGFENLRRQATS